MLLGWASGAAASTGGAGASNGIVTTMDIKRRRSRIYPVVITNADRMSFLPDELEDARNRGSVTRGISTKFDFFCKKLRCYYES